MKSYVILALLLIWQGNAFGNDDVSDGTSAPPTDRTDDIINSPRILVTLADASIHGHPVDLARKLLLDLQLFNLIGEVVQATLIKDSDNTSHRRLLFEMTNALQAKEVVQVWSDRQEYPLSQTELNFFDSIEQ